MGKIKASDLRIGNLVYSTTSNKIITIITLRKSSDVKATGIPLTEQWFLDFGFEKHMGWDDIHYWTVPKHNNFHITETSKGYELPSEKVCESVHILQNAYYFSEFEELTLKSQ